MPSVEQWKLDVFARGSTRQEIKALENKPEFTVADIGQLIAIQMRDIGVIEEILSAGGSSSSLLDGDRGGEAAKSWHRPRSSRSTFIALSRFMEISAVRRTDFPAAAKWRYWAR